MSNLTLITVCGFGNQLFYIFNAISLILDYNMNLIIDKIHRDRMRPNFTKYLIFNSEKLKSSLFEIKDLRNMNRNLIKKILIKQKGYEYEKIHLQANIDYLIDGNKSGFFQSYKFFWHNKDRIKEYINFPNERFNQMKERINEIGKKTLGIHIRLTDYIKNPAYFYNYPVSYYQNVLLKFNLSEYQIILFSDDPIKAIKMLNFIPQENIILANTISLDDEDQFYLLMLTNVRIIPNSTYSLWTCYLNEIYEIVNDAEYWLGNKWFGPRGPRYNLEDLIPVDNPKFKIYNI